MRTTNAWMRLLAAGVLLVSPVAVAGSTIHEDVSESAPVNPATLEARARQMFASPTRYAEAARLFARAAGQRDIGDPLRVEDLVMASRLTYYHGNVRNALDLMQRAASEALSTGDVIIAAHRFMDGAVLAHELGDADVVESMATKAERLSHSPLLTRQDRDEIRGRIRGS